MKKFFSYITIFLLIVGFFLPSFSLTAETTTLQIPGTIDPNTQPLTTPANTTLITNPFGLQNNPGLTPTEVDKYNTAVGNTGNPDQALTQVLKDRADAAATDTGGKCLSLTSFSLSACVFGGLAYIAYAILGLMSLLLWLAGSALNWVINTTVVEMSAHINTMTGINVAWKVIRDLMNIGFIFLLVYEGIVMIIGSENIGAKKLITGIIIASLLINFSLFFTKILIDASNIVTIGFYNSISDVNIVKDPSATPAPDPTLTQQALNTLNQGISGPFMQATGVNSFFSGDTFDAFSKSVGNGGIGGGNMSIFIIGLAGSILFLVLSFVFLAITVMFVIRYITLIFLLMLSPVGFMGTALPFISKYSKDWWNSLKGQLLFGPIYMILTWVVLTLISSPGFISAGGSANWGKLFLGDGGAPAPGSIGLLVNFAVIIGLVILSLTVAKNVAKQGSDMIGKATNWATAAAGGVLIGGTAALGRNTIGRAALGNTTVEELETRAKAGDIRAKTRLALATNSYDARKTSGFNKLEKVTDVDFGRGTKGLPFFGNEKAGEGGRAATVAANEKKERERKGAQTVLDAKEDIKKGSKAGATPAEINAMEIALAKLSEKETETLVASNKELLASQNFANSISVKQLDTLNKSEKISEIEKSRFKNLRFADITAGVAPTATLAQKDAMERRFSGMGDKELEILVGSNKSLLGNQQFADTISVKQLEALNKSDQFSESEKESLKARRFSAIDTAVSTGTTAAIDAVKSKIKRLSDSELEMIDPDYLKNDDVVSHFKQSQIDAINKNNKFTSSQKANLAKSRLAPMNAALTSGNTPLIQSLARKADPKTMASYISIAGRAGIPIALDPDVLPTYNPKKLTRMADEMSDDDKLTLKTAILAGGHPDTVKWLRDPDKGGTSFI